MKRQKEYCGFTMLVLICRYHCITVLTSQAAVMQASTELCGWECSWIVPPMLLRGRVGNALMQLNDSNIVGDVRECQILIHDAFLHFGGRKSHHLVTISTILSHGDWSLISDPIP